MRCSHQTSFCSTYKGSRNQCCFSWFGIFVGPNKRLTTERAQQTPSTAEILYFHQHARLLLGKRTKVTLFTKETSGKHALFPSKGFYYALQDMRVGERNTSPGPARPTDCSWTETNTENPVSCSVRRRMAVTSLR